MGVNMGVKVNCLRPLFFPFFRTLKGVREFLLHIFISWLAFALYI